MKLVSYNIQYGTGKDGIVDLQRIASEIGDADVIALQEVERFNPNAGMVDQVAELARCFADHYWVYGPGLDMDASYRNDNGVLVNRRYQFGNMLLSKVPIQSSRNHLLPRFAQLENQSLQRSMIEAVIDCELGLIRVYCVHLGHSSAEERERQIGYLMEVLQTAPDLGGPWSGRKVAARWYGSQSTESQNTKSQNTESQNTEPLMPRPAIFMGDFNLEPTFDEYELLTGRWDAKYGRITPLNGLIDAWVGCGNDSAAENGLTCPHDTGDTRIDYAFVSTDLASALTSMRVDQNATGSDHQPIFIEMERP